MHESGVLGASPAGIIRRADLLEVMQLRPDILEVMCPFTARNMTIPEAIYKEFYLRGVIKKFVDCLYKIKTP